MKAIDALLDAHDRQDGNVFSQLLNEAVTSLSQTSFQTLSKSDSDYGATNKRSREVSPEIHDSDFEIVSDALDIQSPSSSPMMKPLSKLNNAHLIDLAEPAVVEVEVLKKQPEDSSSTVRIPRESPVKPVEVVEKPTSVREVIILTSSDDDVDKEIVRPPKPIARKIEYPSICQVKEITPAKLKRPLKPAAKKPSAKSLFETEAQFDEAETTDEERKHPKKKKAKRVESCTEDEDEDALDDFYRQDPELRDFVTGDHESQGDAAQQTQSFYRNIHRDPPMRGMKFQHNVTLTQKYGGQYEHKFVRAASSSQADGTDSEYGNDSFIASGESEDMISEDEDVDDLTIGKPKPTDDNWKKGLFTPDIRPARLERRDAPDLSSFGTPCFAARPKLNRAVIQSSPPSENVPPSNDRNQYRTPLPKTYGLPVIFTPAPPEVQLQEEQSQIVDLLDGIDFDDDFEGPNIVSVTPAAPDCVFLGSTNITPIQANVLGQELVNQVSTVTGQLTVLVDARELRTPVCSILRNRYNVRAIIRQLSVGDYICSHRVGIERKSRSDLLKSMYNKRLLDQTTSLRATYDVPMILVEDEPTPAGQQSNQNQFDGIIAMLARQTPPVKLLFSSGKEESARIIADIAQREAEMHQPMSVPTELAEKSNQMLQFILCIPKVSYITASYIVMYGRFNNLREFVNCDEDQLMRRVPKITRSQACKIVQHMAREFVGKQTIF